MNKISPINILLTVFIISLVTAMPAAAGTVTVCDFEDQSLNNGDPISAFATLYPGVTFSGGPDIGVCVKDVPDPIGWNYWSFPPHSGNKALAFHFFGNGDAQITATFTQPVSRVKLWYTSTGPVTLNVYDKSNNLIATKTEAGGNTGTSSPIEVSGENIAYAVFHDTDYQLVMDDFEFESDPTNDPSIPEFPSIVLPIAAIMGLMFVFQRRKE